jgi:hypothetical protein
MRLSMTEVIYTVLQARKAAEQQILRYFDVSIFEYTNLTFRLVNLQETAAGTKRHFPA